MSIIDDILGFPTSLLELYAPRTPPWSSLFIILVAILLSLFTATVSRRIMDLEKLRRYTRETKAYNKLRMQVMRTADKRLKMKLDRNADRNRKIQSELMSMRMKPMLYTMLPILLFFFIFSGFYNYSPSNPNGAMAAIVPFEFKFFPLGVSADGVVSFIFLQLGRNSPALPPGINSPIPGTGFFVPNFVWWYFGTSITAGQIIQKLAGLTPE